MRMFVDAGSIYLHRDAVDFRKSINGLVIIVEQEMELSPFAPALFVFCNKNRDRIKVLYSINDNDRIYKYRKVISSGCSPTRPTVLRPVPCCTASLKPQRRMG
jgi:hypothetical protein